MRFPRVLLVMATMAVAALGCNLTIGAPLGTLPTTDPLLTEVAAAPTASLTVFALTGTPVSTMPATPLVSGCTPRADWPTITVAWGETLFTIAPRVGASVDDLVAANCLASAGALVAGQQLHVPSLPPATLAAGSGGTGCAVRWFFGFDEGKFDAGAPCPNPVVNLSAAGQNFEGGRVLWYAAEPGSSDPRPTLYVIYNDRSWITFPDTWDPSQPEADAGIIPPPDRRQPVRSIGKIWRENAEVRGKLGWAYEPEQPFNGRLQTPANPPPGDPYFYLDHGAWGVALRLYAVNMGPNRWEVAGHY